MANEIALFKNFGLATPSNIAYSESMNAFVTSAQTFPSGNAYGSAARFAEGLLIKEDIGYGQPCTFLNGLHIYDLKTHKLLAEKVYPLYQGAFYSKDVVKSVATRLLSALIVTAAEEQGSVINAQDVTNKVRAILDRSFANNQLQELEKNVKALGF